jgi:hypothetical protein
LRNRPVKRLQNVLLLSGGEKAMAALIADHGHIQVSSESILPA